MAIVVLYLDKLNEHMEKMLLEHFNDEIDVRFLNPTSGKKGELKDAHIFIVTTYQVTKEIIDAAPNLKLIQRTGIGIDMVDVSYAAQKGIPVSVCKGFNSTSVAELAILDMLALYRKIVTMDNTTKKGEWHTWTWRHESYELVGKTVGVIGAGAIGRNVIKRAKAFDTKVIYYDKFRVPEKLEKELGAEYRTSIDAVIKEADVITLHLPLLPETEGIIGEKELKEMKDTAILVNTARDSLIDLEALIQSLRNGEIAGAAVDVLDPITEDSPLHNTEGLNLILTPHIGAATYDNYDRVYQLCASNAVRIMRGEEPEMLL
jgi:phosphoglycerate dehydrogenase-like enzyme